MAFYDRYGKLLPDVSVIGDGNFILKTVDIPTTAYYVQICNYENTSKGANTDTFYAKLYTPINTATTDKKILIFGDSITESATMSTDGSNYVENVTSSWVQYIPEFLNTKNYVNFARSGAHYCDFNTSVHRQKLSDQISLAVNTVENADIIILALGTNDVGQSVIGDYSSAMSKSVNSLDRTELYQAIRYAMYTLKKKYPNAKAYVVTPIQRADREPHEATSNAIKVMGNRYGFTVIDAEYESGIIRDNEVVNGAGTYLKDGLHTNEEGRTLLGRFICNAIKNTF